ncbi:MAG: hypothetical protein Q8O18_04610, partial [Deltaproteobacteria bacterium]|nr:hypothetical protein [Deltaproteobacteria bacterium]
AKKYPQETDKLMVCLEVGKLLTSTLDQKEILELIMLKVSQLIDAQTKKDLLILADNLMYGIKKASKNGIGTVC